MPASTEQTKKTKSKEASKTAKAASPMAAKVVEGCCKEEPKDDATPGLDFRVGFIKGKTVQIRFSIAHFLVCRGD